MVTRFSALPGLLQYAASLITVLVTALVCYGLQGLIGYRVVALVLLLAVSVLAMLLRMGPVMAAAALSALVWNFLFIPPVFTLHIGSPEDALMLVLYFVVAAVNAVLSTRIRAAERRLRDKEEKEKAIALYNTLLHSLSHELRTPIAAIIGATDTLKNDHAALTAAQRVELLETMEEAGTRLDRQVGNLLHMGRLESGMLVPRADWCDVNELLARVRSGSAADPSHRIAFDADPDLPLFKLDGGLLEQIVNNLLLNAVQHTPFGTTIGLAARSVDGDCLITVEDDGPGLSDADRSSVFQKFHRGTGARTGGTGLGLSIVKGFAEAMGGAVTVEPLVPRGLRFIVRLPAAASHLSQLKNE